MVEPYAGGVTPAPPPLEVLRSFGVEDQTLERCPGGRGLAWRAGDVVLKPVDHHDESEWVADLSDRLVEDGFRISRPVPSRRGGWVSSGWVGWSFLEGRHDSSPPRWREVVEVCHRFHAAIRHVPEPAFLQERTDAWSVGDHVAWGEREPEVVHDESRPLVDRMVGGVEPVELTSQMIHGDLSGNLLFAPGVAPAVIDLAPYHRPAEWALAVVAVDAIAYWSADATIVDLLHDVDDLPQLMRRAAIYRLITTDRLVDHRVDLVLEAELACFEPVVELVESLG
jgi:uncharacterized protein (TIGR02569 family)